MSDNLDTLRKIAEAATQGVWERFDVTDLDTFGVTDLAHVIASELETEDAVQAVATGVTREDAHHIATFDPPAVLALLSRLEQAEQKVASLEAKMDGENLRWVAWEMVENSGHLDLPVVTWINRISDDEVSIEAAKYFFFGGTAPCIHMDMGEPFDIEDEDRPACEHCNRRALDGDIRG